MSNASTPRTADPATLGVEDPSHSGDKLIHPVSRRVRRCDDPIALIERLDHQKERIRDWTRSTPADDASQVNVG
jgi:hypothetical protein